MPVSAQIKRASGDSTEKATKPYLVVDRANEASASAVYLYKPKPGFKQILLERLAGPSGLPTAE
jgi:hypothetical protein